MPDDDAFQFYVEGARFVRLQHTRGSEEGPREWWLRFHVRDADGSTVSTDLGPILLPDVDTDDPEAMTSRVENKLLERYALTQRGHRPIDETTTIVAEWDLLPKGPTPASS